MKNTIKTAVLGITALATITSAQAATIVWGSATDITAITDVSTNGTLEFARNEGGSAQTINTVSFAATNTLGTAAAGQLFGAGTGDAAYNDLLDNVSLGGGTGLISYDLGILTLGDTYEIQIWYTDQRNGTSTRVMQYGSTDGTNTGPTVDLAGGSGSFGQFATGTFTVDADGTPDLTLDAQGFGNAHLMAIQVRNVTVPEPSSTALLGLGGLALILRRRK